MRISAFILATISFGVPAGKNIAYQLSDTNPGYMESIVGRSGKAADFFAVVTASALTLPDLT